MNKVMLAGYVQGEPEHREMQGGKTFYVVKVVTTRYFKDEAHEDVIEVSCFGRAAKAVEQYVANGSQVIVEGNVRSKAWKDKFFLSINAETITPVEALGGDEPKKKTELAVGDLSLEDDDILF